MSKEYKLGSFILLGISTIISFALFNTCITDIQEEHKINNNRLNTLNNKIDSLENVINASFKYQKDTIIVNVCPQQIKIYTTKTN